MVAAQKQPPLSRDNAGPTARVIFFGRDRSTQEIVAHRTQPKRMSTLNKIIRTHSFVIVLITLNFASSILNAQHLSPFFQIMSSSPLVKRPTELRELQTNVDEALNQKAGLHLPALFDKLTNVRKVINEKLDELQEKTDKIFSQLLSLDISFHPVESKFVNLISKPPTDVRSEVQDLYIKYTKYVAKLIRDRAPNTADKWVKYGIDAVISIALEKIEIPRISQYDIYLTGAEEKDNYDKISARICKVILSYILNESHELYVRLPATDIFSSYKKSIELMRTFVLTGLDNIEQELREQIARFSSPLTLEGNTGFGATVKQGDFGSSLGVSFNSESLKLGAFTTYDFAHDTTKTGEGCFGGKIIYAPTGGLEIDLGISTYFGNNAYFKDLHYIEAGGGFTFRWNKALFGPGFYYLRNYSADSSRTVYSLGISVQSTEVNSPTIIFGYQSGHEKSGEAIHSPFFQILYPFEVNVR